MKKILWLRTGGTIECARTGDGLSPDSGFRKETMNLLADGIMVDAESIFSLDSTEITLEHWQKLAGTVFGRHEYPGYDGFVITHGTDTLQYSSAALSHMLENFRKPVVFTGSQKPFSEKDSDAGFNLTCAFAAARDLPGGVYVVFAGKIISGASAIKINTREADAFTDANGFIGEAKLDSARLFVSPVPAEAFPVLNDKICGKVFYLKITPNVDVGIADFILEKKYKGVVCEAYGLGGIPGGFLEKLGALVKNGVRVVVVSQCLYGNVDLSVYAAHSRARGLGIEAWKMTGASALAKLMIELGKID